MSEKILKKWTFGWVFPPFCGFSTKIYLVIHGFYNSRFSPSPKKRELQGPPVPYAGHYRPKPLFKKYFWGLEVSI